ncbi:STAS domain-containing protein [Azotobacter chroococcum subsp. isscasi]|nr:STAS domain-containing protein [Azotobacter chroococcum subsp. isscasi]
MSRRPCFQTAYFALAVLVSQLPKLFGIRIDGHGPLRDILQLGQAILPGADPLAQAFQAPPGILVAVILATLAVSFFDLHKVGVKVLGELPQGLPTFTVPWLGDLNWTKVLLGGFAVALVSFTDTSVLSRTYAVRTRSKVDPNQEMVGLGIANLAAGFFQGIPISSSSSRTPVAEAAGSKTQLTGVTGALAVAALLLVAPNLLRYLPNSALAAVVIAAAIGLFEITDLKRIFRMQPWEFWLSFTCFVGVAVYGAIPGIGLAVAISIIEFLWDGWRPHHAVLGRANGVRGYHDVQRYPDARRVPGLVLFRWDAPLFFANAELFQQRILQAIEESPTPVRRVVVAAEPVTSVDVTSADMLGELGGKLHKRGIELHFAEMKDPVKDKLRQFELLEKLGPDIFQPTVGAAVDAYLEDHGVDWSP